MLYDRGPAGFAKVLYHPDCSGRSRRGEGEAQLRLLIHRPQEPAARLPPPPTAEQTEKQCAGWVGAGRSWAWSKGC